MGRSGTRFFVSLRGPGECSPGSTLKPPQLLGSPRSLLSLDIAHLNVLQRLMHLSPPTKRIIIRSSWQNIKTDEHVRNAVKGDHRNTGFHPAHGCPPQCRKRKSTLRAPIPPRSSPLLRYFASASREPSSSDTSHVPRDVAILSLRQPEIIPSSPPLSSLLHPTSLYL